MLPPPAKPKLAVLTGLACTSPAMCIATGADQTSPAGTAALAEMWNGASWHRLATVNPVGAVTGGFNGISCAMATACMATGWFGTSSGCNCNALAESWNGSVWTLLPVPASSPGFGAVSCATATTCMAAELHRPLAELWNGSAWTPLAVPTNGGPFPGLNGISCPSATHCTGVGTALSTGFAFAAQWTGRTSWDPMDTPVTDQRDLRAIACAGPSSCMAVGSGGNGLSSSIAPVMHWNGIKWQVIRAGPAGILASVSCVRGSHCLAAGSYFDHLDQTQAAGQIWNGRTWRLAVPPGPADALGSTSCAGPSFCLAAGGFTAATWNGAKWTSVQPHAISGSDFGQLSCTSRTFCMAFGGQARRPDRGCGLERPVLARRADRYPFRHGHR